MGYARFEAEIARVNDVLCAINLLDWDANTIMPASGTQTRGHQIATLTGLAVSMLSGESLRAAIEEASEEIAAAPADDLRRRALEQTNAAVDILR